VLIHAKASKTDQVDKDQALAGAAQFGNLEGARALIAYGANPNVDFSTLAATEATGGMMRQGNGAGSVLIDAAESGDPEMVREILRYHPKLEVRDRDGRTAVFAAGQYRYGTDNDGRVECLRLLVKAGADINARDGKGNTILHETIATDVAEELIRLGADVNARNTAGETPIFTTIDNDVIPLLIRHGADLTIRNNKGQTVAEAMAFIQYQWPQREEAFRKALQTSR
jgi:ankyrin repeat protein